MSGARTGSAGVAPADYDTRGATAGGAMEHHEHRPEGGDFAEGAETQPREDHVGSFAEGEETRPREEHEHEGSFAEGEETLPEDERKGSFSDTDEDLG